MAAQKLGGKVAARYNLGKTRPALMSTIAQWAIALDYTYGADKYEDNNWAKGMPWSDVMNSFERHYMLWKAGEDYDAESGLPHIFLAGWNMMTLIDYTMTHPEFDDRMKYDPKILAELKRLQEVVNEHVKAYKETQSKGKTRKPKRKAKVIKRARKG
jgi:hypothetical protein